MRWIRSRYSIMTRLLSLYVLFRVAYSHQASQELAKAHIDPLSELERLIINDIVRSECPSGDVYAGTLRSNLTHEATGERVENRYANFVADVLMDCAKQEGVHAQMALIDPLVCPLAMSAESHDVSTVRKACQGYRVTSVRVSGSVVKGLLRDQFDTDILMGVSGLTYVYNEQASDAKSFITQAVLSDTQLQDEVDYSVLVNDQLLGRRVSAYSSNPPLPRPIFLSSNLYQCMESYFLRHVFVMPDWRRRAIPLPSVIDYTMRDVTITITSPLSVPELDGLRAVTNQTVDFSVSIYTPKGVEVTPYLYHWINQDFTTGQLLKLTPQGSDYTLVTVSIQRKFQSDGIHHLHVTLATAEFGQLHRTVTTRVIVFDSAIQLICNSSILFVLLSFLSLN
eukprot:Blabericola_migrator_1__2174@NODE_15_length_23605_cov_67_423868_g12_i0_p8_GENE_NODE_15_length_23605_cov_67_423868_g12_i0NODE_15_length_23605_cov_67_423868_g12_i0_p8_ORF_typecomplete_len395_score40_52_NODE_15_length_23605_cov_67_423868_g12_i01344014624